MYKTLTMLAKQKKPSQNRLSRFGQWFSLKSNKRALKGLKTSEAGRQLKALYVICIFVLFIIAGCASVQAPTGGPKDIEPPKLVNVTPKNLTTNFNAKKIKFVFDEYIKLQNEFREITYSPEIESIPLIKQSGKEIEITFEEALLPNSTYTINFGNAIVDVNEGNILKNFTYVFSTGPVLDSLSISGKVINSFSSLPEKDILVFIIPFAQDSTFGKKKPAIFTRTDTSGNYSLKNLREDTYSIYALQDKNADRLYQQGIEEIGFIENPIKLDKDIDSINFNLFLEKPLAFRNLEKKINPDGTIFLTFNRGINNPFIKIINPPSADAGKIISFSKTLDTAKIWVKELTFDSLRIAINEQDTLLQSLSISRGKRDTYSSNLTPIYHLEDGIKVNPNSPLKLEFTLPIIGISKDKIILKEDSTTRTNFTIDYDSLNNQNVLINYNWKDKAKYELILNEGAVKSLYNYSNKSTSKRFEKATTKDYGRLDVTFKIGDTTKKIGYLIEMIDQNKDLIQSTYITKDTTIIYNNKKVGKYFIRIVYDSNNNRSWDTGSLKERRYPEKIWYDPRSFTIRTNWEVKETILIPTN